MKTIFWHSLGIEELTEQLDTRRTGLSSEEASKRQQQVGYNELPETGLRPWYHLLARQFKSLLVLILLFAALISALTQHWVDMWVILAVILINALIGFSQELRAERAVTSLKSMLVTQAKVLRNGRPLQLQARELVPGDIIILEEGDSIPADARLWEAKNVRTMEAPLTGESVPVEKDTHPVAPSTPLADRKNMVYKGTFIAGGYAVAVVTATGMQTAIGEIAHSLEAIKPRKTNFQIKVDVLARQMGLLAIFSASLLFGLAYLLQEIDLREMLLISIAALVSVIPEGLPAVLAIVLAIGANRMARRQAIIREFTATETLGAVTTIITDKTGTLTQNTLTIRKIGLPNKEEWTITGEGWRPIGNFLRNEALVEPREFPDLAPLLTVAGWSNNSSIRHDLDTDTYHLMGDPTEGALLVLARKAGMTPDSETDIKKLDDFPFNSEAKMRATLVDKAGSRQLLVVGAPEQVLDNCQFAWVEGCPQPMKEHDRTALQKMIDGWSGEAMRVIALAFREELPGTEKIDAGNFEGLVLAGVVGMMDPPRPEVRDAVAICHRAGIRVIMATGDHINTAMAIGRETGIISDGQPDQVWALTEKQLLALDPVEFDKVIGEINVFARLTPAMKLRIAQTLQKRGELIAMTGDGVNDAPALKQADVGIAMGIMGTDVARDAAKVVLADDNFSTIVSAVEEGRIVFTNARQTSFFLITTNFAEIITLLSAISLGMPLPLTATQLLWLNLVTDGVCDISLATESGHGDVLKQKPVNPKEKILNKEILPFLLINALLMTVLALGAFQWFLPVSVEKGRSAAFLIMAMSQLFNVFNMRSLRLSIFTIGMFSNKYINIALGVSLIIQLLIIEVPFFEALFQFDPISVPEFLILSVLASSVLWMGELYKLVKYDIIKWDGGR
jgi:P-type Ca2+ transporter type 2C